MQQTLQKIHLYIVFCIVIAYLPWIYFKYLEYIDKSFKILEIPFPFNILYILAPVWEQGAFSAFLTQVLQTLLELQDFLNQKKQTAFEMARTTRLKRCKTHGTHTIFTPLQVPHEQQTLFMTLLIKDKFLHIFLMLLLFMETWARGFVLMHWSVTNVCK